MPDLSVLLALVLGLIALEPSPAEPVPTLLGTLASVAIGVAMCWMAGNKGERAARAGRPDVAAQALWGTRTWPLLAWVACIAAFRWGAWVAGDVPRETWLGRYVVLFLPAAALWAAAWSAEGRVEAAIANVHGIVLPARTGLQAVWRGLRQNGLALLPLFILLGVLDGLWLLGQVGVPGARWLSRWIEALPLLSVGVMLALLVLLSHFLPAALKLVLPQEPLAEGRLRSLLEEQAKSIGLRFRDIVVWKTRGAVTNAMVVGYAPRTRTIFLTDGLLRHLADDEILAVFCHEAGHAKKWHLPLLIGLFAIAALLFEVGGDLLIAQGIAPWLVVIAQLAVLWFVILGTVSRFLEREADVYGADHAADLDPAAAALYVPGLAAPLPAGAARMIRALQRVRQVTGRERSHRHGTIEQRITFLAGYATDPDVRERFRGRKRRLLAGSGALALMALVAVGLRFPVDLAYARASLQFEDAGDAYEHAATGVAPDAKGGGVRGAWQAAYQGFGRVADELEGSAEPRARDLRLLALYNRADTALRGLGDLDRAREDYAAALDVLQGASSDRGDARLLRFQAHVDLGRILARQGDLVGAREQLEKARGSRPREERPDAEPDGAYLRARLALLEAAVDAAAGDVDAARDRLRGHVLRAAGGSGELWAELRRDAHAALRRLGGTRKRDA